MKKLIYYILCFIASLMLITSVFLLVSRCTILSKTYVVNKLNKNNYKEETYIAIKKSMEEYIPSSGFSNDIFKDIFTREKVATDIDIVINGIYGTKNINIETTSIKNKLVENMKNELNQNNLVVKDEEINKYADSIVNIYKDKIVIYEKITNYTNIINKANLIITIGIISLLSISIILLLIIFKLFKHNPFSVVFYTVGFSVLSIVIYISCNTNINGISILTKATTTTIITILNNIVNLLIIISIGFIIFATLIFILREKYKSKVMKKHKI